MVLCHSGPRTLTQPCSPDLSQSKVGTSTFNRGNKYLELEETCSWPRQFRSTNRIPPSPLEGGLARVFQGCHFQDILAPLLDNRLPCGAGEGKGCHGVPDKDACRGPRVSSTRRPPWGPPARTVIRERRQHRTGGLQQVSTLKGEGGQLGQAPTSKGATWEESTVWGCHPPRRAGTPT